MQLVASPNPWRNKRKDQVKERFGRQRPAGGVPFHGKGRYTRLRERAATTSQHQNLEGRPRRPVTVEMGPKNKGCRQEQADKVHRVNSSQAGYPEGTPIEGDIFAAAMIGVSKNKTG